jgi:hypothetical protein
MPASANNVISYIKRNLGDGVIEVNVSEEQILDRILDALQFFRDYSEDGTERTYVSYQLTQTDIDNNYVEVSNNVVEVVRVINPRSMDRNKFTSIDYNMAHLINFSDFMGSVYTGLFTELTLMKQKIEEIDQLFRTQKSIRFNNYAGKLYWEENFSDVFQEGDWFVYEAFVVLDPGQYERMWSNRLFLDLATALVKKQWGTNLKKFGAIPLFGGMTISGQQIYNEAVEEIRIAKDEIINQSFKTPFFMG